MQSVKLKMKSEKHFLRVKDEIYKKRSDFDLEIKRDRAEIERMQSKLNARYEAIEKKEQDNDELKARIATKRA